MEAVLLNTELPSMGSCDQIISKMLNNIFLLIPWRLFLRIHFFSAQIFILWLFRCQAFLANYKTRLSPSSFSTPLIQCVAFFFKPQLLFPRCLTYPYHQNSFPDVTNSIINQAGGIYELVLFKWLWYIRTQRFNGNLNLFSKTWHN